MGELINREDLLAQINVVREPLRKIYAYSQNTNEALEKKQKIEKAKRKKQQELICVWPSIAFAAIMFGPYVFYSTGSFGEIQMIISIAIALLFSLFLLWIFYSNKKAVLKKYSNQEADLILEIKENRRHVYQIATSIDGAINIIPPDYQYSLATEYIYSCILNQRANTIGEAVNLYEDQLHKWRMEQMQSELLEIGIQQQYTLNKIKQADTVSAAANVATAIFAGTR